MPRVVQPALGFAILALVLLVSSSPGCSPSPIAPQVIDLTGTWIGTIPLRMPQGDWSSDTRVELVQTGAMLEGALISRDNVRFPLSGSVAEPESVLTVGGLTDPSCAGISLILTEFDFRGPNVQRVSGRAVGRCFGTVAGQFELRRIG
jgi:hypothetical protein